MAGAWYRFRIAVVPDRRETLVAAKVWEEGTPANWTGCGDGCAGRLATVVPGRRGARAGVKDPDRVKVTPRG